MQEQAFQGIVLFSREHKETDAMVKLFTREYGKQMFFVRNLKTGKHPLRAAVLPFTEATFLGKINRDGLSFLREYREVTLLTRAQDDLIIQAYTTYIVNLCDAVIEDRIVNEDLYQLLSATLKLIEKGLDIEVVTLAFELKLLAFFGVNAGLDKCVVSNEDQGPFDYSLKYGGLLAQKNWHLDRFRLNADPNALYLLQKLVRMSFAQINTVSINQTLKKEMRRIVDAIYDEYVGIHLKSKSFIDSLEQWYL